MPEDHLARVNGDALTLSLIELRMLTELARRADKIVSREELSTAVWGREFRPGDRSIDVYVHKLRVKLETALPGWSFIHTHSGFWLPALAAGSEAKAHIACVSRPPDRALG